MGREILDFDEGLGIEFLELLRRIHGFHEWRSTISNIHSLFRLEGSFES